MDVVVVTNGTRRKHGDTMKELIWDLFKQSGIDIGEDQEGNIEKFAELIVQECAAVYRDSVKSDRPLYPTEFSVTLKEHFGVE